MRTVISKQDFTRIVEPRFHFPEHHRSTKLFFDSVDFSTCKTQKKTVVKMKFSLKIGISKWDLTLPQNIFHLELNLMPLVTYCPVASSKSD